MTFVIIGTLSKSKRAIEDQISKLGGKVVANIDSKLTAVISNRDDIERMDHVMNQAKRYKIQVVSEDFLTAIETEDPFQYIMTKSLFNWGEDVSFSSVQIKTLCIANEFHSNSILSCR